MQRHTGVAHLGGRPKQCRRVVTRYEQRAATFLAMVTLAVLLQRRGVRTRLGRS
jgi:hypothetical protein